MRSVLVPLLLASCLLAVVSTISVHSEISLEAGKEAGTSVRSLVTNHVLSATELDSQSEEWTVEKEEAVSEMVPLEGANGLRSWARGIVRGFRNAVNFVRNIGRRARGIFSKLKDLPVIGDVIRTVTSFVELIKAIVKLFKFIISGGVPGKNYFFHLYQGFQKLFETYKSDRQLSCLYTHIFKLESLSFNLGFPFGMSMECSSDWNCFKCVGHIMSNSHRMLFDFLTVMINALTGSQAEEALSKLESVSTMEEVEYRLQLIEGESIYTQDSQGDDYRLTHMLAMSKTPLADKILAGSEQSEEEREKEIALEQSFAEEIHEHWDDQDEIEEEEFLSTPEDFPTIFLPTHVTPLQEEMITIYVSWLGRNCQEVIESRGAYRYDDSSWLS